MDEPAPAPRSTRISSPAALSLPSTSGTRATRRSPGAVSLATPTFMGTTLTWVVDGGRGRASAGDTWVGRQDSAASPGPRGAPVAVQVGWRRRGRGVASRRRSWRGPASAPSARPARCAGIIGRVSIPPRTYEDLRRSFRWQVPERYNIAVDAIDRQAAARPDARADRRGRGRRGQPAGPSRTSGEPRTGSPTSWPRTASSRATGWRSCCRRRRRRRIAHLAAYRAGLIAVPLFVLFGPEALEYRLADSGAAR